MVVVLVTSTAATRHRVVRRDLRLGPVQLRRMRVVSDEKTERVVPLLTGVVEAVAEPVLLVALRRQLAEMVATVESRRLRVRASPMAVVVVVVVETRVRQAPRQSSEVVVALEVVALVQ